MKVLQSGVARKFHFELLLLEQQQQVAELTKVSWGWCVGASQEASAREWYYLFFVVNRRHKLWTQQQANQMNESWMTSNQRLPEFFRKSNSCPCLLVLLFPTGLTEAEKPTEVA